MSALAPTLSHPSAASPHSLNREDEALTFPQLVEAGPHVTEYTAESRTGVVSAKDVGLSPSDASRRSSATHVDLEAGLAPKGEKGAAHGGEADDKLVTWLEEDPENPRNFSTTTKWVSTILATLLCFNVGLASAIITGGLTVTMLDFNVNEELINLTVAVFVIGFGVGPLFLSPLSEIYGRKVIYLVSMAGMCIFSIPEAVTSSFGVLIAFRLLAGILASAPMCNAAGTIADVWSVNERGHKMAAFSSVLFAAPCIGPPIGGYITMYWNWRGMYWVQVATSGALFFATLFFLPETYAPTLLGRRAAKLRKDTGDVAYQTAAERLRRPASEIVFEALARPCIMLATEPIMICFSAYLMLIYSLLYGFFFAYPIIFAQGHGFNAGQTGLTFFGILLGIVLCGLVACPIQENYYRRQAALSPTGNTTPEKRLPLLLVGSVVLPISLGIFAGTSDPSTNYWGVIISGIPFGFSLVAIYISANTYLVDTYSRYGASAMAAKTFARSMAGASVPLWINYMYESLGNRWAGALLCFISIAMMPIGFVFWFFGAQIRAKGKMATSD